MMSPELREFLRSEWYGVDYVLHVDWLHNTALHMVSDESVEMVKELMLMMCDVIHYHNHDSETALHRVCINGSCAVVALLLSHIDQRVQSISGRTALHVACQWNYVLVPLLKWHEIPNNKGQTPKDLMNGSHIHTLAKLRRLLGTLPAAYIRLVHAYT